MKKSYTLIAAAMAFIASSGAAQAYNNNLQCREYTRTIYIGGQPQQGFGTACLQPDGSWQVVSDGQIGATVAPQYITERVVVREPVYVPTSYYSSGYYPRRGISISIGNHYPNHRWHRGYHRHYQPQAWHRAPKYYKHGNKHQGRWRH